MPAVRGPLTTPEHSRDGTPGQPEHDAQPDLPGGGHDHQYHDPQDQRRQGTTSADAAEAAPLAHVGRHNDPATTAPISTDGLVEDCRTSATSVGELDRLALLRVRAAEGDDGIPVRFSL
ncbi:hypothetical protein [Actinoplanes sp. NBRC 103695]|uniref:hypothetical protein n=1 Tax=Actinoplanes sp. NBRC 103695 TaxID=3032202 RepID=UPI0024A333F0|nr:hypothetical protein [Actinoplanes sp. NBRC 103695]GLZ02044.1 hypothetical protein Acsp02_92950 [Actinoplanes sp. NBRC 103695]